MATGILTPIVMFSFPECSGLGLSLNLHIKSPTGRAVCVEEIFIIISNGESLQFDYWLTLGRTIDAGMQHVCYTTMAFNSAPDSQGIVFHKLAPKRGQELQFFFFLSIPFQRPLTTDRQVSGYVRCRMHQDRTCLV